jgi:hypothetical protein
MPEYIFLQQQTKAVPSNFIAHHGCTQGASVVSNLSIVTKAANKISAATPLTS